MKKYGKKILVLVAVLALIVAMGVPALGASAENTQTVATPVEADADGNHIISVAYDDGYATPPADESAETIGQPVEGAGKITIDLPYRNDDGSYEYNVDAFPKETLLEPPVPTPTPTPTPTPPPNLPQTGQLWWPVPLLAGIGLIFLIIGLIRKKGTPSKKVGA